MHIGKSEDKVTLRYFLIHIVPCACFCASRFFKACDLALFLASCEDLWVRHHSRPVGLLRWSLLLLATWHTWRPSLFGFSVSLLSGSSGLSRLLAMKFSVPIRRHAVIDISSWSRSSLFRNVQITGVSFSSDKRCYWWYKFNSLAVASSGASYYHVFPP